MIPISKPYFNPKYEKEILNRTREILYSGILTNGEVLKEFEKNFSDYIGVRHSIGVSSGTAALEIILRTIDVKNKEVIVPSLSFIASANSTLFAGGKPVLADVNEKTLCLDFDDLEKKITKNTKAIVLVHLCGFITPEIKKIMKICDDYDILLVEDSAQAHGSIYDNKKAGSFGFASAFSFYPSKLMTTGEGGMITTNYGIVDEIARSLRYHGINEKKEHIRLGNNWRLSEFSSLLGIYQLKQLEEVIRKRNLIAKEYEKKLSGVKTIKIGKKSRCCYYRFPIILPEKTDKKIIQKKLLDKGIDTRGLSSPPIHLQPLYKNLGYKKGMLPITEGLDKRIICLPIFAQMSKIEADNVIETLEGEL